MLPSNVLLPLLLVVPGVLLACQAGGWVARRIGQPTVVGEILVGVLLGPSLLGWLAPDLQQLLLPTAVLPITAALGNLALLVFVFLIGHELDLSGLRTQRRALVGVSLANLLLPLALGAALASALYPQFAPPGIHRLPFTLFVAVALSITAFPVLARLLDERGLQTTPLGSLALAVAAIDDAIAWCLLAVVVALATTGTPLTALGTIALLAGLILALNCARPAVKRLLSRAGRGSDDVVLVLLCAGLWLTAYATDRIGIHPAVGAFLFGAITSREVASVQRCTARLRAVFVPVLLPLYFLDTGLHTNLSDLSWGQWGWTAAVLAVAVTGKWAGTAGAARLGGQDWRQAVALGVLMNCRGLTELVVLGIGRQIGVITDDLFTILVFMAIVTTAATAPLLDRLIATRPARQPQPPDSDAVTDTADGSRVGASLSPVTVRPGVSQPDPVLQAVLTRRSVLDLIEPAPEPDEVLNLVQAAATSPDHGLIRPWRLISIESTERLRLGEVLRQAADTPQRGQRAAVTPGRAPLLLGIVFRPDLERTKVPEWEQLAATVAMTQTLLLLLHGRGWGATWRTGPGLDAACVREYHGLEDGEQLLGWLYIGTPSNDLAVPDRRPPDVRARISRPRKTLVQS